MMITWFKSIGKITYGPGIRAVLLVDQGISTFYYNLIPKHIVINPQKYPAHISFVRYENPPNMLAWSKYEGQEVGFEYSNEVRNDETYFWLDVHSQGLEDIRVELGLQAYPPWANRYHITIANKKQHEKNII